MFRGGRRKLIALCLCMTALVGLGLVGPAGAQTGTTPTFALRWSAGPFTQDKGSPIAESSPTVATLDATGPAVVVGDRSGYLYAYHLADGSTVTGWPVFDGGAEDRLDPLGGPIGHERPRFCLCGCRRRPGPGRRRLPGVCPNGQPLWRTVATDPVGDPRPGYAVPASLTVADLQGSTDVFAGSVGQDAFALDASSGSVLPGWPFFTADSVVFHRSHR
jgi:hypothetical protein